MQRLLKHKILFYLIEVTTQESFRKQKIKLKSRKPVKNEGKILSNFAEKEKKILPHKKIPQLAPVSEKNLSRSLCCILPFYANATLLIILNPSKKTQKLVG